GARTRGAPCRTLHLRCRSRCRTRRTSSSQVILPLKVSHLSGQAEGILTLLRTSLPTGVVEPPLDRPAVRPGCPHDVRHARPLIYKVLDLVVLVKPDLRRVPTRIARNAKNGPDILRIQALRPCDPVDGALLLPPGNHPNQ